MKRRAPFVRQIEFDTNWRWAVRISLSKLINMNSNMPIVSFNFQGRTLTVSLQD